MRRRMFLHIEVLENLFSSHPQQIYYIMIRQIINKTKLLIPKYFFTSKLDKYKSIRERNLDRIKKRNNKNMITTINESNHQNFQASKEFLKTSFGGKLNCEGCSATLQSKSLERYGYIDENVLSEYIKHNKGSIQHQIQKSQVNYEAIREVQEQLGIKILDPETKILEEINDIDILLKLQQKIDALNKERQTLVNKEYRRKQLYCRRCYYLKHHNQLPDEHNSAHNIITETNTQQLLDKIFSKKDPVYYFYLVDPFDMCGTLTKTVLQRLFRTQRQFSMILTKSDVINKKYMNYVGIKPLAKARVVEILEQLKAEGKISHRYNLESHLEYIYMLSNANSEGINKIKKKIEGLNINVQLIGYPNTGKTSLLNILTSMKKPTSTVPGTSLSFQIGKFNNIKIFDCPGFYNNGSMYNLISRPNERKMMTWKEPKFAPGILTNSVIFFGGMLQIEDARVVVFGHGGAKAVKPEQANEWLLTNYSTIWAGLPHLSYMRIKKYEFTLEFVDGNTEDLQIAGYGFIGFKLFKTGKTTRLHQTKKLKLFLPEGVDFIFRKTLVLNDEINNPSSIKSRFLIKKQDQKPQIQAPDL